MKQRWTTFFAAAVLVASLACGAAPDVEEEQVPSSFEEWLEQAEEGDARAQYMVGLEYGIGRDVVRDDTEAVRWFRLAADQGHASAQYMVGVAYGDSQVIPQDVAEAVRWYRLAADQGFAAAQFNLGNVYSNGEGVPQDDAEAVRWYRLAADQGFAAAQFNLGVKYSNGEGVPQDDVQAYMWFNLFASRTTGEGRDEAVELRDRVANRLTPDQRAEAQRLAREWDEAHPRD
jgi:hypothetical protein